MKTNIKALFFASHLALFGVGFGVGIYVLPILTAEKNSSADEIKEVKNKALLQIVGGDKLIIPFC
ncbi:Uncharacterised protein [Enterobacter hormaechei]|uniref:hypothetical protein n=1 Tax=Enterobacter hormaechei TaxID=158836 RepID=UPI00125206D7|nr:hypothetical protein [Enterobacter hormaechei]VAC19800.1 Uncharacterised protein [Enterobacter hormaechei]VAC20001.1 Uncharacterised protein [Enterobacter hormaechei]